MNQRSTRTVIAVALTVLCTPALAAERAPAEKPAPAPAASGKPGDKVVSPRDPASGLATGKRQHKPVQLKAKDGKMIFEITPNAAGQLEIKLASGADGPAARVPDGELLLEGGLKIRVEAGFVVEGGERIGIAPLPSP
ncbi:hypothetical protein L6V77_11430 [Myxococcota bacterium]|nr:hypothetical protein [Myxococcota bacterium]